MILLTLLVVSTLITTTPLFHPSSQPQPTKSSAAGPTRYLGFWIQEANVFSRFPNGANFANMYFGDPPYPSSLEIMTFGPYLDGKAGGGDANTVKSINYWSAVANAADAYPNARIEYMIALDMSNSTQVSLFQQEVTALKGYPSIYSFGIEGEYSPNKSLAEMQSLQTIVQNAGKPFISYSFGIPLSDLPSGAYLIGHSNWPGGDSGCLGGGNCDQENTITNLFTSSTYVGISSGYYAQFTFPGTSPTCPIPTTSKYTGSGYGWNQCVVDTEINASLTLSSSVREFVNLCVGFGNNQYNNLQLMDYTNSYGKQLRDWIYASPEYQANFILSNGTASGNGGAGGGKTTSTTAVTCSPSAFTTAGSTICTATVSGNSTSGSVSFSSTSGGGSFSPTSCTLSSGTCATTYSDATIGSPTLTGSYAGDTYNTASSGTTTVTVTGTSTGPGTSGNLSLGIHKQSRCVSATTCTVSGSVSVANSLILVTADEQGSSVFMYSISDSASNAYTQRIDQLNGANRLDYWWTIWSGSGSLTVTVNTTGSLTYNVQMVTWSGENLTNPFDPHSGLAKTANTGANPSVTISTTDPGNVNEAIIGFLGSTGSNAVSSNLTQIIATSSSAPGMAIEYVNESSPQSGFTVAFTDSSTNTVIIADAIIANESTGPSTNDMALNIEVSSAMLASPLPAANLTLSGCASTTIPVDGNFHNVSSAGGSCVLSLPSFATPVRLRTNQSISNFTFTATATPQTFTVFYLYEYWLNYTITAGGTGYAAPTVNETTLGVSGNQSLSTTSVNYYFDAGSLVAPINLIGSGNTERWNDRNPSLVNATPGSHVILNYTHQYYLKLNPIGSGTINTSSDWFAAAKSITLQATPNSGYVFEYWNGTGTGSYNGTANPAVITNDPVVENATFGPAPTTTTTTTSTSGGVTVGSSTSGSSSESNSIGAPLVIVSPLTVSTSAKTYTYKIEVINNQSNQPATIVGLSFAPSPFFSVSYLVTSLPTIQPGPQPVYFPVNLGVSSGLKSGNYYYLNGSVSFSVGSPSGVSSLYTVNFRIPIHAQNQALSLIDGFGAMIMTHILAVAVIALVSVGSVIFVKKRDPFG